MKTHDEDPTTNSQTDPWDEVTSEFGSLSDRLKETYRKVATDSGPSEDEIKEAFSTLIGVWDQVAESVTAALQDPETRNHLKQAASSFSAALGETISGLGNEIRNSSADRPASSNKQSDGVDGDGGAPPVAEADQ